MPQQSDFPENWQCQSDNKRVVVELRVPNSGLDDIDEEAADADARTHTWIEIPTSSVEQWVEKGDAAQIQRTAKVRFPTEWGDNDATVRHNSPRRLVQEFSPDTEQPFMHARIWWQDTDGTWILQHYGWVGGVGSTADAGTSKLWIYDFAELLSGVPIGETFKNPTVGQALERITRLTNDNTPIPVGQTILMSPQTEEEFTQISDAFGEPATRYNAASDTASPSDVSAATGTAYYSFDDNIIAAPKQAGENFDAVEIGTDNRQTVGMDSKSFIANHDTMLDIYEWFEGKTAAKLHFSPRSDSVALVADVVPERRVFAQNEVISRKNSDEEQYEFHENVVVIRNDALYEMKPINTIHLRGATARGLLDETLDFLEGAVSALPFTGPPPAEKYPVVKVQAPALVEAAEGVELSPEVVESNASQLDTAEQEARRRLAQHLEETTEGEIILSGTPRLMPYDRLDAFETCQEEIEYEQEPVQYEVESVKHEKTADNIYKTRIKVSVWANDETIETVRKTLVEVSGNRQV